MILIPNNTLAVPADAAGIAVMSREYIEYGLGWSWTTSRVRKSIVDRATNVAVIRERDELAGFGIMRYGDYKAHLVLLCVHAAHRQRGLGAQLLAWLEKCATTAGLERIELEARADNPVALAFYRGQGYRQTGQVAGYYQGAVDAVRLEKSLRVDVTLD